ncbi:MAG: hypothetical protein ABEI52_10820 [Halobacteriaceae archaeon]
MRGQTSFDFMVGMGLFLVTVGFVLTFIPGMFQPFTIGSSTNEILADRSAARLAEGVLAISPARPAVLDRSCVIEFFDDDGNTGDCRYASEDPGTVLALSETTNVNVTLQRDGDIAILNGQKLASGPAPTGDDNVAVARRRVSISGTGYTLEVRVW